ncbi:MAG: DNA polymerase III subunit alpha, partial [Bacteroidales bacterium]|nr:DNA polymerase III subunit alpha [Bacteroidales bacterium]
MSDFSHLHVHTEYSILDGLASIPDLIRKAYNDGQRSMAVTDHGNMYGIYSFLKEVENFNKKEAKQGDPFKAIIGCEVYVARVSRLSAKNKEDRSGHHLVLLAKNMIGYRNLSRLLSLGWTEGFYYTPRIDKEILRKYSEGIIACSACLGGELPQAIMNANPSLHNGDIPIHFNLDSARKVVEEFKSIFGSDYYIELQRNGHKEQTLVNAALLQLSEEYGVKCIATNDSHFVNKEDFSTHKVLICINTGRKLITNEEILQDTDTDNGLAYSGEEYFKTTDEMKELFADVPEAILNTQHVADKIEVIKLKSTPTLPHFEVPKEFKDDFDYLQHLTYEGAKWRWGENLSDEIKERLEFELNTVKGMGYPGYFLIVRDFINAGREQGIRFGPGRGSAAGSAIAYCLNITNIDPIKYDLLFERFLNPDRISLPDMDIDMEDSGREKMIHYVSEKYGKEKVAQIVTFNTMAAKSAIRDCARVLDLPLNESDRIAKMIPTKPKTTIASTIRDVPEFKNEMENGTELVKRVIHFAIQLEGKVRSSGVHACGVIIGRDNLIDCIPLCSAKNSDTMVTQYEGSLVEDAGLLKIDFLGLKTLNIITSTLENIKKRFNLDIEIDEVPLDDAKTFDLYGRGDTIAVFQFESDGMRKYLQELKPARLEDIIAM